jgi:hypothetical protein
LKRGGNLKRASLVLIIIGVCLLIIAPIWAYVIVPPQLILPEDVEESVTYTGETYMANPTDLTQQLGPYDLRVDRSYEAVDSIKDDEVLIIEETATVTIDSPMFTEPQIKSYKLAVERDTYEHYNKDGDSWDYARYGRFTFGPHPEKKDVEFWLHDINDTVIASYIGTTSYKGLDVIEYSMSGTSPVTKNTDLIEKYTGMAYYYGNGILHGLDYQEDSMVYVDEVSGVIVYLDRTVEFSGDVTFMETNETHKVTFSKMSYQFDEETSDYLIDKASDADDKIQFYETTVPLIFLISGSGILVVYAIFHIKNYRKTKAKAEELPA